ncbi:MAG: response regulator [Alphaproteobacteria bacterium]|nr:response regulator [Alphaproteobacteria bacterium]
MAPPATDLKVLIAEDHFAVRQMITSALREKSVTIVDAAADGKQTRDMIDEAHLSGKPYDVVFLDWDMPVMTGINVLKHFRSQPQFVGTAFVMVTAMSTQANVLEAVKSGATGYMIKPVSQSAIGKKFDEVVSWVNKQRA